MKIGSNTRFVACDFGGLPFEDISRALQITLKCDVVHMSEMAHEHIAVRHSADYSLCMKILEHGVASPDFAGQTMRHPENFFLIKELQERTMLIAISKNLNQFSKYPLQSSYLIDSHTLHRRIRKGFVKPL